MINGRPGRTAASARSIAIVTLLDRLDEQSMRRRPDPAQLMLYRDQRLDLLRSGGPGGPLQEIVAAIEADANAAIARRTFSVLDKTGCAPSGNRRDTGMPPLSVAKPGHARWLALYPADGQRRPAPASMSRAAKNMTAAPCSVCSKARRSARWRGAQPASGPMPTTAQH